MLKSKTQINPAQIELHSGKSEVENGRLNDTPNVPFNDAYSEAP